MPDPIVLDLLQRLGVALAIGFLVGVERGWRHRDAADGSRAAGLRTHALIGLFGGLAALLRPLAGEWSFAALTICFSAAFVAFKLRESDADKDISVTGTIAGLMVFALGAYAVLGDMRIAAAAGVAITILLAFKQALHVWLDRLTWPEIRSALMILAATAIALPLLPDQAIDPWGAINPRTLWLLTILVAGASFAAYVAVRALGQRAGLMIGAAGGALVSSTLVTAELGRRARAGETSPRAAAAAANLAATVSVARVGVLACVFAPPLLAPLWAPLLAAGGAFLALSAAASRGQTSSASGGSDGLKSPFELWSVLKFAALLGAITVAGQFIAAVAGESGLLAFAAAAGLADVDAAAVASSGLVNAGLQPAVGAHAVLLAVLSNSFAKVGIAFFSGGARYGSFCLASTMIAALAGIAAFLIT